VSSFEPHLTPKEMLEAGVFGGAYFERATDADWRMAGLGNGLLDLNKGPPDWSRNRYGVRAGQTHEDWLRAGWLFPEDPLGWFHWYCRYAAGRRHHRDAHQIRRWRNYGLRWGRYARTQMHTRGDASPVVKQGLLQWAYEPMRVLHEAG